MKTDWRFIEGVLRHTAGRMVANPGDYSATEGQMMDRALRTCPMITDIDVVWVLWRFVGEPLGWITDKEMTVRNGRFVYPRPDNEENK